MQMDHNSKIQKMFMKYKEQLQEQKRRLQRQV